MWREVFTASALLLAAGCADDEALRAGSAARVAGIDEAGRAVRSGGVRPRAAPASLTRFDDEAAREEALFGAPDEAAREEALFGGSEDAGARDAGGDEDAGTADDRDDAGAPDDRDAAGATDDRADAGATDDRADAGATDDRDDAGVADDRDEDRAQAREDDRDRDTRDDRDEDDRDRDDEDRDEDEPGPLEPIRPEGTVKGRITEMRSGTLYIGTDRKPRRVEGTPYDLHELTPGDSVEVPYREVGERAWVWPAKSDAERPPVEAYAVRGIVMGPVTEVDRERGLLGIGRLRLRAHPTDLEEIGLGQVLEVRFVEIAGRIWVHSVEPTWSRTTPAARESRR